MFDISRETYERNGVETIADNVGIQNNFYRQRITNQSSQQYVNLDQDLDLNNMMSS